MILLIDIGNTYIKIGYYDRVIKSILKIKTGKDCRSLEEYEFLFQGFTAQHRLSRPDGAVLCSVVPQVTDILIQTITTLYGIDVMRVSHTLRTGLHFRINNVDTLGTDRIANAVASHHLYRKNTIIVDFGTATTLCLITEEGEFRGGTIMPGIGLSARVLAEETSLLPHITLDKPDGAIGTDTAGNIRSGLFFGHAGAVERIINEMSREFRGGCMTVATGGYAEMLQPFIASDHVNALLTLEGLRFIYELNS